MSSIDQTYFTGTPSAAGGQGAFLSSEKREDSVRSQGSPGRGNEVATASDTKRTDQKPMPTQAKPDAPTVGIDPDKLNEAVEEIRERLEPGKRSLDFSINDELGDVVVRVVDTTTDQVIREIPPEAIMAMRERLRELNEAGVEGGFPPGSFLTDLT